MTEPNTPTTAYEPEAATNLFDQIEAAYRRMPDYKAMYRLLQQTYRKCLSQKTGETRLTFATGDFARTDYLLKEYGATRVLAHRTNDTRRRLSQYLQLSDSTLQQAHRTDIRNLCEFIGFLYGSKVPMSLQALYPTEQEYKALPAVLGDYMRVIVEQWDETYIYVHTETESDELLTRVRYDRCGDFFNNTGSETSTTHDWSYLRDLFYAGAQLNLLRPREEDGVLYPELIIFEPDYLINVTTVAHCFSNYADSPLVDLPKKLGPAPKSSAILLGNLAGQLLDESIHQLSNTRTYLDCAKDFFRNYAIDIATTDLSKSFHEDAMQQKQHIEHAMHEVLPSALSRFNSKEGLVEPTFFSEMLGLQGRMDYLQLDYKVLLEQKSGSGKYVGRDNRVPHQTEEHYVQLLLYALLIRYNYREQYEKNHRELHTFLLYSKYEESLLDLGIAPDLIFRAIKVRNELASAELHYARPDGFRFLENLTTDDFNLKKTKDTLWQNYQSRQIEEVLAPIHQASPLEKAYYLRMLNFVASEHVLSKLGNQTKENSGFAATWQDSLEEKRQAGNIYDCLELVEPNEQSQGSVEHVQLRFAETADNDMSNFRVGDIVILYPYDPDKEPDARRTMVFRCTIEDIQVDTITLQLRAAQSDNRFFVRQEGRLWAIEHDFMESSYSGLYRGVHAFLSAPKSRRDLLLLQRRPEVDTTLTLRGNYGNFNDLALRVRQARELFLIIGPPGTGKTSFGMLNTVKEELLDPSATILLMSFTNRAVDEICSKLQEADIDFLRIGNTASCPKEQTDHLLSTRVQQCGRVDDVRRLLDDARILVGTTTSLSSHIALLEKKSFSLAVIDEASQILEPHLLGLLSAHQGDSPAIRKMVLIGDHKQLPAVVQQKPETSRVQDAALNAIHLTDCRLSLFERLLRRYQGDPEVVYMLKRQGRMHPDVALFPNIAFYAHQLQVAGLSHQTRPLPPASPSDNGIDNLLQTRRFAFVAAEAPKDSPSDKVNQTEADIITAIARRIYELEGAKQFDPLHTLGIIVPYRNQIATIRNTIDRTGITALHDITIDTVERYQGSQRKYILYGFTIQQYYQLEFLTSHVFDDADGSIVDRKLNVAMTRAMEHLILVGNPKMLVNNYTFYKLLAFAQSQGCYLEVPTADFVAGHFTLPSAPSETVVAPSSSIPTAALPEELESAFDRLVLQPLSEITGSDWHHEPSAEADAIHLDAIGYGRNKVTTSDEALLYAYYYLRPHYHECANLLLQWLPWMEEQGLGKASGVLLIDMGCGLATFGLAWDAVIGNRAPNCAFVGIEPSAAMRQLGSNLLDAVLGDRLHRLILPDIEQLENAMPRKADSAAPRWVIWNFSHFFANTSAQAAEGLAKQMCSFLRQHPSDKHIVLIQQTASDAALNAYMVFRRIITCLVHKVEPHEMNLNEGDGNCYEVFSS
ncbi:MAG: AAA family ATPase [Bacteroidales bacterium]|nr:AAA family ATPase [Bacteroidales bacterium]